MNKVFCKKRWIFSFLLTGYLILFNTSCGLDTLYVIDAPTNTYHIPECDGIDETDSYFEFSTVDHSYGDAGIKFKGTEVYYKIYTSSNKLKSERDSLISLSEKDESSSAANRLIETYKFQPLRGKDHYGVDVLIPTAGENQRVWIRLSDYAGTYFSQILVDGDNIYDSSSRVIPVRNLSTRPSFNFKTLQPKDLPKSGDGDFETGGSNPSDTDLFVSMFAVAVGFDAGYSPVYSNILYLGSVHIPKE